LVDLDGDGRKDMISGSWPGEIYFFRRLDDGSFAIGEQLKYPSGKPVNVGSGSAAFAFDWNGDGALDLVVGNVLGELSLVSHVGHGKPLAFENPTRIEAAGAPMKVAGDAAPVVADWDGDGQADLIVGAEDGSVVWCRNIGSGGRPVLEKPCELVPKSPVGWNNDDKRRDGQWGLRVKPCAIDWDGDGRADLLLGDMCGGYHGKPSQTAEERTEESLADDQLPELRKRWAAAFAEYKKLQQSPAADKDHARRLDEVREVLRRTKDEIAVVQQIQGRYQPTGQRHGFVWLFRRKPR
jgi:hypothetical protein